MPSSRTQASTCAPKASLISMRSMSASFRPVAESSARIAATGPMPMMSAGHAHGRRRDDARQRLQLVPLHVRRPSRPAPRPHRRRSPSCCRPSARRRTPAGSSPALRATWDECANRLLDERLLAAGQPDTARLQLADLEVSFCHRADLAGEEAALLRGERPLEAARGVGIHFRPADVVAAGEILGRAAHVGVDRRDRAAPPRGNP